MYGKPTRTVTANGRSYRAPERPTVVVCVDGSEPGYIEKAAPAGIGAAVTVRCALTRRRNTA
jgi:hypothetical protein